MKSAIGLLVVVLSSLPAFAATAPMSVAQCTVHAYDVVEQIAKANGVTITNVSSEWSPNLSFDFKITGSESEEYLVQMSQDGLCKVESVQLKTTAQ